MVAPPLLTSRLARCEAVVTSLVCLFYAIATVFQIYHGSDMMYEMRSRKPEPTLLRTQRIFNLPHHIGMVREELAFNDAVSYAQWVVAPQSELRLGSHWFSSSRVSNLGIQLPRPTKMKDGCSTHSTMSSGEPVPLLCWL